MHYDYLIVGAGLFGAVFAHEKKLQGKTSLVIDRRDHIAGNVYTETVNGIHVHRYGAHIFHTSDEEVGITSGSLRSSTTTSIPPLPAGEMNCTTFPST